MNHCCCCKKGAVGAGSSGALLLFLWLASAVAVSPLVVVVALVAVGLLVLSCATWAVVVAHRQAADKRRHVAALGTGLERSVPLLGTGDPDGIGLSDVLGTGMTLADLGDREFAELAERIDRRR